MSPFLLSRAEIALNRIGGGLVEAALKRGGKWFPPDALCAAYEGRPRCLSVDGMRASRLSEADRALILTAIETAILQAP